MKFFFTAIVCVVMTFLSFGQETISGSIGHDGLNREYILYVPASYSNNEPAPLILNFHGYTSNAFEQMIYGDFRSIADTAGFIVVHPLGTTLNGSTHWNVGGFTTGSTVDDVGFTEALIDKLSQEYNIDGTRVYSTGMSNGGYMSYLLACQLSDRIAAIASVTGSMSPETHAQCDAKHPTPVLQIHGTDDGVVPYEGAIWSKAVEEVVNYWVEENSCSQHATIIEYPDQNTNDGSTATRYNYGSCSKGIETSFIKINGGDHTWPGSIITLPGTNQDINASLEIWKFFSSYDISGLINSTSTNNHSSIINSLFITTNPTDEIIRIGGITDAASYIIFDIMGNKKMYGQIDQANNQIDVSHLANNQYFFKVGEQTLRFVKLE